MERIKNSPHQVAADVPHHVTQRGNTRRFILASDTDRSVYLTLLRENIEICRVFLPGCCLMSNHIHLAAVPKDKKVRQKITTRGDRRNGTVHTYQVKCHFRLSRIVFVTHRLHGERAAVFALRHPAVNFSNRRCVVTLCCKPRASPEPGPKGRRCLGGC